MFGNRSGSGWPFGPMPPVRNIDPGFSRGPIPPLPKGFKLPRPTGDTFHSGGFPGGGYPGGGLPGGGPPRYVPGGPLLPPWDPSGQLLHRIGFPGGGGGPPQPHSGDTYAGGPGVPQPNESAGGGAQPGANQPAWGGDVNPQLLQAIAAHMGGQSGQGGQPDVQGQRSFAIRNQVLPHMQDMIQSLAAKRNGHHSPGIPPVGKGRRFF
jgi:hypothetical protein